MSSLRSEISDSLGALKLVLDQWNKLDQDCEELEQWLKVTDDVIQKGGQLQSTFVEKRALADEFKVSHCKFVITLLL